MRNRCVAIQRNGVRCTCYANDDGDRCGRHGGPSKNPRRKKPDLSVILKHPDVVQNTRDLIDFFSKIKIEKFSSFSKVDDIYCFICCSENVSGVTVKCCNKNFCSSCLSRWLKDNKSCPHCRETISDDLSEIFEIIKRGICTTLQDNYNRN
jgi:hypothetical protein